MKTRSIIAAICMVSLLPVQILCAGGRKEVVSGSDQIELSEAFQGGLIRITLTGMENGQRVELDIERRLPLPMIILIPKGASRLGGEGSPEVVSEAKSRVDLTAKSRAQVTLTQPSSRIARGKQSMEACFNATTGKILKRLKKGRELLFEQVVAQLGEKETYKRKLGARALGEAGDVKAISELQKLAKNDPDAEVRAAAQEAIEHIRAVPK